MFARSAAAALFAIACHAQTLEFNTLPQSLIDQRLESAAGKNAARLALIRRLFQEAGCAEISEQPVKGSKEPNLICVLASPSGSGADSTAGSSTAGPMDAILVGAHYDFVESGSGIIDNWSGASLLSSLYQGLAGKPRRHSYRFIAFAGEEKGLLGSRAYVRELSRAKDRVGAMVNLDTLGLGDTEVWVSRADPQLVNWIGLAAVTAQLPVTGMNVESVGSTDSEPFRDAKFPSITLHSLTTATLPLLHGPKDQMSAMVRDAYYRSYRLILTYLAVLDQKLP